MPQESQAETPLTVIDLGRRIKAKYPEYADLEDAELGRRIKAKYPEYDDFLDTPAAPVAAPALPQPTGTEVLPGVQGASPPLGSIESPSPGLPGEVRDFGKPPSYEGRTGSEGRFGKGPIARFGDLLYERAATTPTPTVGSIAEAFGKGTVSGSSALAVGGIGGGGLQFIGAMTDVEILTDLGLSLSEADKVAQKFAALPEHLQVDPLEDPSVMLDATWLAHVGGTVLGSMLPLLAAGWAAAGSVGGLAAGLASKGKIAPKTAEFLQRWAGPATAGLLESISNGSSTFADARDAGASVEDATKAAALVFSGTAVTSIAAFRYGIFNEMLEKGMTRALTSAGIESAEEVAQGLFENFAAQGYYEPTRKLSAGLVTGGIGGLMGGGLGAAAIDPTAKLPPLPTEEAYRAHLRDLDFTDEKADVVIGELAEAGWVDQGQPSGAEVLPGGQELIGPPAPPEVMGPPAPTMPPEPAAAPPVAPAGQAALPYEAGLPPAKPTVPVERPSGPPAAPAAPPQAALPFALPQAEAAPVEPQGPSLFPHIERRAEAAPPPAQAEALLPPPAPADLPLHPPVPGPVAGALWGLPESQRPPAPTGTEVLPGVKAVPEVIKPPAKPVPAPVVEKAVKPAPPAPEAVAVVPEPEVAVEPEGAFSINEKQLARLKEGDLIEASLAVAENRYEGQQRLKVVEIEEDGSIYAEPVDGGRGGYINETGAKTVEGFRLVPKEIAPVAEAAAPAVQEAVAPEPGPAPEPARVEAVEGERPAHVPAAAQKGKRGWRIKVADYDVEAERFQFRVLGLTDKLKHVTKWDTTAEKNMAFWLDPADGRPKLIDGHHQDGLLKRLGITEIEPTFIEAKDAQEARAIGALLNLREGTASPLDAAKFLRDTGRTVDDLAEQGIPITQSIIRKAEALTNLDNSIFQEIALGRIREDYGVAIGNVTSDPVVQKKALEVITKRAERTGRKVDADLAEEIASRVAGAGQRTETQETLFGPMETTESLFEQEASLAQHVRGRLAGEKRLFGTVAQAGSAKQLEQAGNVLAQEENLRLAQSAKQAREVVDKLLGQSGPINDIIQEGARRLAAGEKVADVQRETYSRVREAVQEIVPGRPEEGRRGSQEGRGRKGKAGKPSAQANLLKDEEAQLHLGDMAHRAAKRIATAWGFGKTEAGVQGEAAKMRWDHWREAGNPAFYLVHMPSYIAEVHPEFAAYYERARAGFHEKGTIGEKLRKIADPYFKLDKKERIALDKRLFRARAERTNDISYDGLNQRQIDAHKAMRKMFDEAFLMYRDLTIDIASRGNITDGRELKTRADVVDALVNSGMDVKEARKRGTAVAEILKELDKAKTQGYVPYSRFGAWKYGIKDTSDNKIRWEKREDVADAIRRRNILKKTHADKLADGTYELIDIENENKDLAPDVMQGLGGFEMWLMLRMAKVDPETSKAITEKVEPFLKKMGYRAHFTHAEGVPGFEEDLLRPTADYVIGLAGYVSRVKMLRDMNQMLTDPELGKQLPPKKTQLVKYTKNYIQYLQEPQNELQWMKAAIFHFQLGAAPVTAGINLLQVPMGTAPWLMQYSRPDRVVKEIDRAYEDVGEAITLGGKIDYSLLPEDVRDAATQSLEDGTLRPQQLLEFGKIARGSKGHPVIEFATDVSGAMFGQTEHVNRIVTFVAAHRLHAKAKNHKFKDAFDFSENAVDKTQFEYGTYNRATFMRGKKAPLAAFKSFSLNSIEMNMLLARRGWKNKKVRKALYALMGAYVLASGWEGLPFHDTVAALSSRFFKTFGEEWDIDEAAQEIVADYTGPQIAELLRFGLTRLTPFDLSQRAKVVSSPLLGVEEVIKTGDILSLTYLTSRAGRADVRGVLAGERRALETLLPGAARGIARALRLWKEGLTTRAGGQIPFGIGESNKLTTGELITTAFGVTPRRVSRAWEQEGWLYRLARGTQQVRNDFVTDWAKAIIEGRDVTPIIKAINKFNEGRKPGRGIDMNSLNSSIEQKLINMLTGGTERQMKNLPPAVRPAAMKSPIPGFSAQ